MSSKRPEKIWGLVYNMMKSVNNDVPTILRTLDQVLSQKPTFDMRFDHDSIIPRSFVIWLVNQLLNFTGRPLSNRVRKQNVQLLKKLLTFCCLHMPQLFENLLVEYSKTLNEFIEVCFNDNIKPETEPRSVTTFTSEDVDFFKEIDDKFVFERITVSLDMVDLTMQSIVEVLIHAMNISFSAHRNLFEKILQVMLELFLPSDVYTKLECLGFGVKFFNNLFELDPKLTAEYVILFEYCQLLWENLPNWIGFGFLDEYGLSQAISTSLKLAKCNYKTYLNDKVDSSVLESLAKSCEAILRTIIKNQDRIGNRMELKSQFIDYILQLHQRTGILLPQQSFLQLVQSEQQIAKLFGAMQGDSPASSALTRALKGNKSDHPMVKIILNTVIDMEHKSLNAQQIKIHVTSKNIKELPKKAIRTEVVFSCNDLEESLREFLRIMETSSLSLNELCDYIEISSLFLQAESLLKNLSTDLQIALIDLTLFYLRHHSKIKQKLQLKVPNINHVEDKVMKVSLEALASVAHQSLAPNQASSYFHKAIKELICAMYPVCQSEPIKSKLNESLLDFVANSVISIKLIVCHMLPVIVKSPMNSQTLFKIKCICCSALGSVYIFKLRSENHFEYEFLCEDCEKPSYEDFTDYLQNRSAVLMQHQPIANSFEESAFTFVLNSIGSNVLFADKSGVFAVNHFSTTKLESQILSNSHLEPEIVKALLIRTSSRKEFPLMHKVGVVVLQKVRDSLEKGEEDQMKVLHLISVLANIEGIPELWLFHFFKMTFFYMICCESAISNEAAKCATEMCANYGVEPIQLWYWYKRECLSLVVDLTTHVYLKKGQGLLRTLNAIHQSLFRESSAILLLYGILQPLNVC